MHAYLLKKRELSEPRGWTTQRAIAQAINVNEAVISRWHRLEGFDDWVGEQTDRWTRRLWPDAKYAGMLRARRTGDPREIETMGRVTGQIATGPAFGDPLGDRGAVIGQVNNYAINFLVPRPEVPAVRS